MTTSSTKTNTNTNSNENALTQGTTSNLVQNNNSTSSQQNPWQVQAPYLSQAFQQAAGNLDSANANTYQGPQVAQFTPDQLSTFQKMIGYSGNTAGADTSTGVGINTATAGSNALMSALKGLNGYTPQGGADSNIAAATAYANNPATDGMIDAAMRDARRSVSEGALPQLARSSATSGNTMSSRRAISEGIVERGLADQTADTSASIRGDQFNKGLALAEAGRQSDNSAMLDALKSSASAGNGAVGTGVGAIGSGISQQGGLFDLANAGGAGQQAATQAGIDNSKAMPEYANSQAAQNLQNFFKIIGGANWGGSTTGNTTGTSATNGATTNALSDVKTGTSMQDQESTPSLWNTIGSALGLGSSLLKLSDRRMKKDVKRIGTADNGLPIYVYRYLNGDAYEVGFMAQDVEKVRPEAVTEINGIKHVNYVLASQ